MKHNQDTDETLGSLLRDTLGSELRPEVETRLRAQLAELRKLFECENAALERRSRAPGRSILLKAALGTVCAAVVACVCLIILPPRMPRVLAATVEAIREATSMICEITVKRESQDPIQHTLRWVAPDRIRADYGGQGQFINETWWVEGDRVTILDRDVPFAVVTVNMPRTSEPLKGLVSKCETPNGLVRALRGSEFGAFKETERIESDGKLLLRLENIDDARVSPVALVIDGDSRLPIEMKQHHPGGVTMIQHFRWNVSVDASLMIPALPEGLEPRVVDGSKGAFPHVIRPGDGVGPIRLGMSKEEVHAIWGKAYKVPTSAHEYLDHGVGVMLSDKRGVVEIACHLSEAIALPFKTFTGTTPEGVGIGATEQEVIDALGQPDKRIAREHGMVVLDYGSAGIRFVLQPGWVKEWGDQAHVTGIRVSRARSPR